MSGVLDGIRVIDFGQYMAGPMAGMFLGDFGADVIRVERPGGPVYDVPANATWNRNKRSITLDLNTVEDLAVARDLVAHADVVIENFRPDMMAKWGLDWDTVKKTNPGLVYCAIKGFAATDPRYRLKATEDIVAAAAGIHAPTPISGIKHPVYTAIPLSSMYGAHWAAVSIGMALNAREQSGIGQFIEVPLFGVALTAFSGKLMRVGDAPEPEPRASGRYAMCQDGRWLMYFPKSIGSKPALMEEMGMPWYKDTIEEAERERRAAVVFATQPTEYWSDAFARHGIEGVVCNRPQDWVRHHLARDTKAVEAFEDPVLGRFVGPGIIPRLSETPGTVRSPRPRPNQHGAAIRDELKCWARPQERSVHPILSALEGIKVVDMGIVLASPSCGRTLAEFGANLIKVDSPARNPLSWHNDINRGKRSILLDLKHPRGKAIFWKLLEDADVVLENFRAGVAERMGFGYEAIRARNPGVIYSSVNAYGQGGTYTLRPGREPLSQAITGMQMRYGGGKPAMNNFIAGDYATGLVSAFGIACALLRKKKTGKGQRVSAGLIYSSTMLQSALLQDFEGKAWDEPSGPEVLGTAPWSRAYQARDGWLFIDARREQVAQLVPGSDASDKSALEAALEKHFAALDLAASLQMLDKAGIPAHHLVMSLPSLNLDPVVRAEGYCITREHESMGPITTIGTVVKLSHTPVTPGNPASKPGADARSILADIGMEAEFDSLLNERIIVTEGVVPGGSSFGN